ncbi:MAG TPA: nucleotidyltransferase domain-containing protein [Ktedonobacterales bacterium]
MADLDLAALPDLPQTATISRLAPRLWADPRVAAIWIGGSLARGAGDEYSDVDLRVAVAPDDLPAWGEPDLDTLFSGAVLGRHVLRFGADAILHHLVLANGDIFDFLAQTTTRTPTTEPLLILGCRDADFAHALAAADREPHADPTPATPEAVRQRIVDFWITSHKHRKVLHRGLDLMIPAGLNGERMLIMELWYLRATGELPSPHQHQTIHSLTAFVRAVDTAGGTEALALVGAPLRTRAEMDAAITHHRAVVAELGRQLATRYGFAYPAALEEMVAREWCAFQPDHDT